VGRGVFGGGEDLDGLAAEGATKVGGSKAVDSVAILVQHADGEGAALRLRAVPEQGRKAQ
jgi:hypothetical protein